MVNNELKKDNLEHLLEEALDSELKAKEFYLNAHNKAKSKSGKQLFKELAEFEQNHYDRVKEIIEDQTGGKILNESKIKSKNIQIKPEIEGEFEPNKDEIVTVINLAIDAEIKAQERYTKIAKLMSDEESKKIFQNLAQDERNHQRILEDEFYHLSNKGTIIWE